MSRRKDLAHEYASDSGGSTSDNADELEGFTGRKKRRKFMDKVTKRDRAALGDEDDEDDEPMDGSLRNKGLSFVAGGGNSTNDRERSESPSVHPGLGAGSVPAANQHTGFIGFRDSQTAELPPQMSGIRSQLDDDIAVDKSSPSFARSRFAERNGSSSTKKSAAGDTLHTGIGARMLAAMGYKKGSGLGSGGQGMLNPIETKLRPTKMGLGGIKEKTEQAKAEAKRRGEVVSEDDEEEYSKSGQRRRKGKLRGEGSGGGSEVSTPRPRKPKYRTAAEISQDSGVGLHIPSTLQKIVDMTGREAKVLASASSGLSMATTQEQIQLDEEHRISEMARNEVESFASEWKSLQDQKKYADLQESSLIRDIDSLGENIDRLQALVEQLQGLQAATNNTDQRSEIYNLLSNNLERLQFEYREEILLYSLDDATVGALVKSFRQSMVDWNPLEDSAGLSHYLSRWRQILRIRSRADIDREIAAGIISVPTTKAVATSYENLIHAAWLPRVRNAIQSQWDPHEPSPLLDILDAWLPVLPAFITVNLLDQVILPKIKVAVSEWNPRLSKKRRVPPPHIWVFPWLPYLGNSMSDLVDDIKRKFAIVLSDWKVFDGVIQGIEAWREIFEKGDLESLLLKNILPKLALTLRDELIIDPSDQDLEPLGQVLQWRNSFRKSTFVGLLESEFWNKWLRTLHYWLTSENANFGEISQWYQSWQNVFPEDLRNLPGIQKGFAKGLNMMNDALELGDRVRELEMPHTEVIVTESKTKKTSLPTKRAIPQQSTQPAEITFKDIVEDFCASHDLLLIPLRRAHDQTGFPLWRITASPSGTGGVFCYFHGDVIFVRRPPIGDQPELWQPLVLEDLKK